VLVLDDYHLITNPACHQTLGFFLDHLPTGVRLVLSTRVDPPLPLARMRARGELAELRAADLQFTDQEATALLNGSIGLDLAAQDVERLVGRTEGWAAGLVLAGLSLRGRPDPGGFIAGFQGTDRYLADYLGGEVLKRQPEQLRDFLLRTSVLERLSGPLCDAVLQTQGSAERLGELERSNLFLVPLDDRRQWYRYHQLFAELLRLELADRDPDLVRVLHQRAAAWHQAAGHVEEAIHHATAASEFGEAGALIARHWLAYWRRGRQVTVTRWLEGLPAEAILAQPPVAFVAAWIGGYSGASKQETERLLVAVQDASWEGVLPEGISSLAFGAAQARAALVFDDVGGSVRAARRALELAGPQPSPYRWMAQAALGQALYLAGRPAQARPGLEELVGRVSASVQPYAVVAGLAVLSLLADDEDDDHTAASLAARAAAIVEAEGLEAEPLDGIVHLAVGRALTRQGKLTEAQERLGRALAVYRIDSMAMHRAHALLSLASVRHRQGQPPRRPRAGQPSPPADRTVPRPWHAAHTPGTDRTSPQHSASPADHGCHALDRAGAGGAAAASHPALDPRDRPSAVCFGQHRQEPCPGRLPQARGRHPHRGNRPVTPTRPAPQDAHRPLACRSGPPPRGSAGRRRRDRLTQTPTTSPSLSTPRPLARPGL
jgi:LuxR family transcriptional regulator, maltose regulon positive regulatory protein